MKMNIKAIINKKMFFPLFLIMGIIIYMFYSQVYPYRLWRMGEDNVFLFTADFSKAVLTSPAGLAEWVGLWLSQWYCNVIIGILIHTLLLCLLGIVSFYTLKRTGIDGGLLGLFILPVVVTIVASFYTHTPVIIISQIVLWSALLLYLLLERKPYRLIVYLLLVPVLFFFLPGGLLSLFYFVLFLREAINDFKSKRTWMTFLLFFIALVAPLLWNALFYEPIALRYSFITNSEALWWTPVILALPMILFLFDMSGKKAVPFCWAYILELLLLIVMCALLRFNMVFRNSEECYHLEYLSDSKMWNRILQRGRNDDLGLYDLHLKYSVLSLIELNKLPEVLFSLPVTPLFEYTYPTPNSRMTYGFNSRFYQSLNLTNEAMHCLFQDACMSDYGINFRTLRKLMECAQYSGNEKLVKKYFTIYSKSNLATDDLEAVLNKKVESTSQLPQLFISSTESKTFMRILSNKYSTPAINDCLLCDLLIHKDLKTFGQLASYCLTSPQQVRGCYKEAALLCYVNGIPCGIKASEEAMRAYTDLRRMMNNGQADQIESVFAGSYMKYYYSEMEVEEVN